MTENNFDAINKKSKEVWEKFIKKQPKTNLMFPDELLIRIFSNRYVKVTSPPAKLLDHGFGSGNNLVFFASKNYECYGCEIAEELIKVTREKFKKLDYCVNLKPLKGDYLPYEDNFFDIIVSWNVIHYLGKKEKVIKIINDFYRVLKPNGVLILSTLHPETSLIKRSKKIDKYSYLVIEDSKFDNRKGLTLFFPEDKENLINLFSKFSIIKYGSQQFNLFLPEKKMAARLIYAKK